MAAQTKRKKAAVPFTIPIHSSACLAACFCISALSQPHIVCVDPTSASQYLELVTVLGYS